MTDPERRRSAPPVSRGGPDPSGPRRVICSSVEAASAIMVSEMTFSASLAGKRAARTTTSGTTRKMDTTKACCADNNASMAGGGTSSVPYTILSGFRA